MLAAAFACVKHSSWKPVGVLPVRLHMVEAVWLSDALPSFYHHGTATLWAKRVP